MGFGNHAEVQIINTFFRGMAATPPTSVWVALHSAAPDDDGSPANELSGGSYVRLELLVSEWIDPVDDGETETNVDLTWPMASAPWGSVTHVSLWDASSAGNMWMWGELATPRTIGAGDIFRITSGSLNLVVD